MISGEKNPNQALRHCEEKMLSALASGKMRLARCWRVTAEEITSFLAQQKATLILSPAVIPFVHETALLIFSNQEANSHFDHSFKKSWLFARDETQEAVTEYRYWMALARASTSKNLEQEVGQTAAAAIRLESTSPEAAHWAQEATAIFQRTQKHIKERTDSDTFYHELVAHHWKKAGYAAAQLAAQHLQCTLPSSSSDHHAISSLALAKETLALRIKAAEAFERENEHAAIQYSLAALALTQALEQPGEKIAIAQKIAFYRTQCAEIFSSDTGAATCWERVALWLESAAIAQKKRAVLKKGKYSGTSFYWKKSQRASEQAAKLFARAAKTRGLQHFYWKKRALVFEKHAQKKIPALLLKKISFCLTENFLPLDQWRTKWEAGEPVPFDERSKSPTVTSWIYQTWSLLKKSGIDCELTTQFPSESSDGIFLTMTKLLEPTVRRTASSNKLFLVDILADGKPHPAANLHLAENRAYARWLPAAIFVPHWPQPFLIPRDPARGTTFENICFFGEIQNLAPELRTPSWRERLRNELGLNFKIREPKDWHDYHDIDAVIAIRDFSSSRHLQKPATKLYNAWLAGVPFIGGRDAAYAADGEPGKNYRVVTSLEELFQQLQLLQKNNALRQQLVKNGAFAARGVTKEATLEHWKKLIQETIPMRALRWHQASKAKRAWLYGVQRIVAEWVKSEE